MHSTPSVDDPANGPSDDDQSHAGVYWRGGIHVSLSADTDLESMPRVLHPRLLITKSKSSIDDNSLFTNDGFDRYMYSTGKASKVNRQFEMQDLLYQRSYRPSFFTCIHVSFEC